jgi:hypothetical protein
VYEAIEDKIDYVKNSFCEELESVFVKFPKYHRNISLRYFNANVDTKGSCKPTITSESSHEINNDIGVRASVV